MLLFTFKKKSAQVKTTKHKKWKENIEHVYTGFVVIAKGNLAVWWCVEHLMRNTELPVIC